MEWLACWALQRSSTFDLRPTVDGRSPRSEACSALAMTQGLDGALDRPAGRAAVGIAGAYGVLRRWGFAGRDRACRHSRQPLNQFANLSYPVIAVALLSVTGGGDSPVLVTAAIIARPW